MKKNTTRFAIRASNAGLSPIMQWKEAHALQLSLCDELEGIADSLPANIDRDKCLAAARCLGALMKNIHKFEEDVLFPTLKSSLYLPSELAATVERLKFEHLTDECYADDLTERLLYLASGGTKVNMEATGYMLRGFFEAVRRHIAFEREYFSSALDAMPPPH